MGFHNVGNSIRRERISQLSFLLYCNDGWISHSLIGVKVGGCMNFVLFVIGVLFHGPFVFVKRSIVWVG